ncbi:hypothetical protein BWI96_10440 [Siphonobacter sp. SORGH_AS_0500]|nr:hypothetical protein BWI96_10440 [Siphonobacter sp. SORGH_AS_0500]
MVESLLLAKEKLLEQLTKFIFLTSIQQGAEQLVIEERGSTRFSCLTLKATTDSCNFIPYDQIK